MFIFSCSSNINESCPLPERFGNVFGNMWLITIPLILSMATTMIPTSYSTLSDELPTWGLVVRSVNPKEKEIVKVNPVPILPKVLVEIGRCESGNRQFDQNGNVIKGYINPKDIGKYQINISEDNWGPLIRKLGYDVYTEEGNTLMALYIYRHYGTAPWSWSEHCWSK